MRTYTPVMSYTMCLLLIMISGLFITSPTFSSFTGDFVIPSTGMIGLRGTALSGSPADIQAAVDAVYNAGGGTVYIPAGTFHWNGETVNIPAGVNVIGASYAGCMGHESNWASYTAKTILHNDAQPTSTYHPPTMFYVDGRNGKQFRISGIQFEATGPLNHDAESTSENAAAIYVLQGKNFRIDHCTFINFCYISVESSASNGNTVASAYGLVDHCVIDLPYKDTPEPLGKGWEGGYGFDTLGNMRTDNPVGQWVGGASLYAGKYQAIDNVSLLIVEDCHLARGRHAIDGANGGMVVVRYCQFSDPAEWLNNPVNIGDVCTHGGGWGTMTSCVLAESYENTFIGKPNFAMTCNRIRGGSGLYWNNHFHPPDLGGAYAYAQCILHIDTDSTVPEFQVKETYIWNNDYTNSSLVWDNAGRVENVDYFLRAPTQAQDGWTYTPYPYPHPLATG